MPQPEIPASSPSTLTPEIIELRSALPTVQPTAILPCQLRAARALLDWSRNELARAALISPETIKNIEHGIFKPAADTMEKLVKFFAAHGIEFIDLLDFRLNTLSGNKLGNAVAVAGVVLVTPPPQAEVPS